MLSLNDVVNCISFYMSNQDNSLYSAHSMIIRDLCLARDNHYQSPHFVIILKLSCSLTGMCCYFPFLISQEVKYTKNIKME